MTDRTPTPGLPGLDRMLAGLHPGDVVAWQIDAVEEYRELVAPFAAAARRIGHPLV